MLFNRKFILASKSKSRQAILKNNQLSFTQVSPKCDEEFEKKRISKKKLSAPTTSLVLAKLKAASISKVKKNKLVERVHPCLILRNSYISNINGVLNAIVIDGSPVGKTILQGEGAGPGPTTSALISDLCSVLRGNIKFPFGVSSFLRKKISKFDILKHYSSSYLRIEVKDIPGVLSSITKIFAKNKISIKNLIQTPDKKSNKASIIIITHETVEKNYNSLLLNLTRNKFVLKKPTFIRIEKV